MSASQLPRKAEHEEQGKRVEYAMGRVENGLIIVGDGVRWGDVLTAHDPIHQNAGSGELKHEDAEPLEAIDGLKPTEELYIP